MLMEIRGIADPFVMVVPVITGALSGVEGRDLLNEVLVAEVAAAGLGIQVAVALVKP